MRGLLLCYKRILKEKYDVSSIIATKCSSVIFLGHREEDHKLCEYRGDDDP